jgi:hypothetical protein
LNLIVAAGNTRKPKLAAVRGALDGLVELLGADAQVEIVGMEVESGVNHTPLSREAAALAAVFFARASASSIPSVTI